VNPALTRGVESLQSLEAKLREAIRRLLPGASSDFLGIASQFLLRNLSEAKLRRLCAPPIVLQRARELMERRRRQLKDAGVTDVTLERIKELYPLAQDLRRELDAQAQLEESHGCAKCRHSSDSWERSCGARDITAPLCEVYGGVPAFCFDCQPTRFCSSCGTRVSPKRVAEADPFPVECAACARRSWAA